MGLRTDMPPLILESVELNIRCEDTNRIRNGDFKIREHFQVSKLQININLIILFSYKVLEMSLIHHNKLFYSLS